MKLYFALLQVQSTAMRALGRWHRDERGADEGMNKLLIFGLVALPLLALLIYFGQQIVDMVRAAFTETTGTPVRSQ